MNFGQMQAAVFQRLEENSADPDYWTAKDVRDAINEGLMEVADYTEYLEESTTINFANQTYYDLFDLTPGTCCPNNPRILSILSARNTNTSKWLDWITVRDLDYRVYSAWQAATGEPQFMVLRGMNKLGTYPKQGVASGGMAMRCKALPEPMEDDTDTPGFPREFHEAIVLYALYDLLSQDREHRQKAMKKFAEFIAYAERLRQYVDHEGRTGIDRAGRMGGAWI